MKDKEKFIQFIQQNEDTAPERIILSRDRYPDIDIERAAWTIYARKRAKDKLPSWYSCPGIVYPNRLCIEQCSSEPTARLKAEIASEILSGMDSFQVADLTGGLGVDCAFLSRVAGRVLYNDMNPDLYECAKENFPTLGIDNIELRNREVVPGAVRDILGDFRPDMIFLDPARRSVEGRKVFLLEECSPDIVSLQDELLSICPHVLVKISPMADITMVASRLSHIREVFVVGSYGECKELLVHMDRTYEGKGYSVTVCENGRRVSFPSSQDAAPTFVSKEGSLEGRILFVPGKGLSKAGLFSLYSERFSMEKFGLSTHLYLATPATPLSEISPLGRLFLIEKALPLSKSSLKTLSREYPRAEVSSRNVPLTSEELRRRLRCESGDEAFIFALHFDAGKENILLATRKVGQEGCQCVSQ